MGDEYALEKRECKCGCGLTFKTLPTSKARYASITHDPRHIVHQFDPAIVRQIKTLIRKVYGEKDIADTIH